MPHQPTTNTTPYVPLHIRSCYGCIKGSGQKHPACNRPGRPFCDKACNRIGGLATNPPCDKPVEDCSTATRVCNRGPTTKVCNRQGGDLDKPLFRAPPICVIINIDMYMDFWEFPKIRCPNTNPTGSHCKDTHIKDPQFIETDRKSIRSHQL